LGPPTTYAKLVRQEIDKVGRTT